jgi:DNA-binding NarL/FixJ family response regulator
MHLAASPLRCHPKAVSATKRKSQKARTAVLIVDDHPMMRQGLAALINNEPDLIADGEAENAQQAMASIAARRPDIVLADITLPDKSGLELIKDIQALHAGLRVLVVSMHDESLYAERVLRAGGRGYIMKQEGGKKLLEAIRQVLAGKVYVSEKMSARILEMFSGGRGAAGTSPVERLTDREFEVFQLIGQGKGTREIAAKLHVSVKTVEVHRLHIKEKLDLKTAPELIRFAVRWAETQPPR